MKIVTDLSVTSATRIRSGWHPGLLFGDGTQGGWFAARPPARLWQDTASTIPAAVSGAVAAANDISGNGNHAAQSSLFQRPILGVVPETGRRNLLLRSEQLAQSLWIKTGVAITSDATLAPDQEITADKIETTDIANPNAYQVVSAWTASVPYTASVWIRGGNATSAVLQFYRNDGGAVTHSDAQVLSGPGHVAGVGSSGITVTGLSAHEWSRISITGTPSAGGSLAFYIKNRIAGAQVGDFNFIWGAQVEQSTDASAYQAVNSTYEVYETGVASLPYLFRDGVDDALQALLPASSGVTIAWASDQGVTIQTGQIIPSGPFDILRDKMLFEMVVAQRSLTVMETASLSRWLARSAGSYA